LTETISPPATRPAASADTGFPMVALVFAAALFCSAALLFSVQPLFAKLTLPLLGGSPAVWNTSMAFFQAALLGGYAYAHALSRLKSAWVQVAVHGAALLVGAVFLPLTISPLVGMPTAETPVTWLVLALVASVGAPFMVVSATAPLLQHWFARARGPNGKDPYWLYGASNLGSMLGLLAYPTLVEPNLATTDQALTWSWGYGLLAGVILACGYLASRQPALTATHTAAAPAERIRWRERAIWVLLAAAPSSLLMGVTAHITTDVAAAPFLWVLPLALFLLTFVIAFASRPILSQGAALLLQAVLVGLLAVVYWIKAHDWVLMLGVHLAAFFVTALVCHQALVARRPGVQHLTEFYLWMSLGGVVGGAFNAFLAPVIFSSVIEYPLVVALALLARPNTVEGWNRRAVIAAVAFATFALAIPALDAMGRNVSGLGGQLIAVAAVLAALMLSGRRLAFAAAVGLLFVCTRPIGMLTTYDHTERSFFGVHRVTTMPDPVTQTPVKLLFHGTTVHGAQYADPALECTPLTYYGHATPMGQVYRQRLGTREALNVGVVGLGAGALATYKRPGDQLTVFEIDPVVATLAQNGQHFTYLARCAPGTEIVLGDARLTLADQPAGKFDILFLDAFTSDGIPVHLLTREAMAMYFARLAPGGVAVFHISNRNLALEGALADVVKASGGAARFQRFDPEKVEGQGHYLNSASMVMVVGRTEADIAAFAADDRWREARPANERPWTDDYSNIISALLRAPLMEEG
jgi:hypothetical protein